MEVAQILIEFFGNYVLLLGFMAGMINEEVLLFLAVLSGSGVLSFWQIVISGFIGIAIHDAIFYFLGRTRPVYFLKKKLRLSKKNNALASLIKKLGKKGYFLPLFLSKFIYGIRIAMIIYASHKERKFSRYLLLNSLAVLIWFCIMMPLGWLAGKGFVELLHVARGIEKLFAILLAALLVIYLIHKFVLSVLIKKVKKNFS